MTPASAAIGMWPTTSRIASSSTSRKRAGGFRLYTEDDIELLLLIRRMKPLGYSLDDMHHVIGLLHESGRPDRGAWAEVIAEAQRRRENLARQVEMADEFVALMNARFGGAPA